MCTTSVRQTAEVRGGDRGKQAAITALYLCQQSHTDLVPTPDNDNDDDGDDKTYKLLPSVVISHFETDLIPPSHNHSFLGVMLFNHYHHHRHHRHHRHHHHQDGTRLHVNHDDDQVDWMLGLNSENYAMMQSLTLPSIRFNMR